MSYFGNSPISASYLTDYFSGNNTTVAFTLSRAPVSASSVIITISGVKQAASTYGVSGTTLTFSGAPPTGTNNIEVLHLGVQPDTVVQPSYRTITEFTATAGQTSFSPASYTAGYIDVYRNGVKLGTADFTATNGTTVVLAVGALVGDLVTTESFYISSVLNAIPATAGAVNSSYIASGAVTLTTQVTGTLPVANGGTGTILGGTNKIQPITASAASSALTITLSPTVLDFRSATIGDGTVTTVSNSTSISVVVPSTATLGTVSAVQSRLVVLAINNAGTMELAVTNISGGSALDETGVISTTLIAAASNSATLYYSTTARTSVAYRVVGYIQSTQATAGTWATAPSTIQGYGGQAVAAMSSLGYGQTWQNVTGSRVAGTTYYNTTGKPIVLVMLSLNTGNLHIYVNGVLVCNSYSNTTNSASNLTVIVPTGASYSQTDAGFQVWSELR